MANKIEEVLVTPVASMIREVGNSVAEAAKDLNAAQLELTQNYPDELLKAGMIPTIYHMQTVEAELSMVLHIEEKTTQRSKFRIFAAPMNAKYKSALNYEAEGSSRLKMTFAPGPPPIELPDGE